MLIHHLYLVLAVRFLSHKRCWVSWIEKDRKIYRKDIKQLNLCFYTYICCISRSCTCTCLSTTVRWWRPWRRTRPVGSKAYPSGWRPSPSPSIRASKPRELPKPKGRIGIHAHLKMYKKDDHFVTFLWRHMSSHSRWKLF